MFYPRLSLCLFVSYHLRVKIIDRFGCFWKLSDMYLWRRNIPLHLGSHPDLNSGLGLIQRIFKFVRYCQFNEFNLHASLPGITCLRLQRWSLICVIWVLPLTVLPLKLGVFVTLAMLWYTGIYGESNDKQLGTDVERCRRADADVNLFGVPSPLNLGFHLGELVGVFVRVLHSTTSRHRHVMSCHVISRHVTTYTVDHHMPRLASPRLAVLLSVHLDTTLTNAHRIVSASKSTASKFFLFFTFFTVLGDGLRWLRIFQ